MFSNVLNSYFLKNIFWRIFNKFYFPKSPSNPRISRAIGVECSVLCLNLRFFFFLNFQNLPLAFSISHSSANPSFSAFPKNNINVSLLGPKLKFLNLLLINHYYNKFSDLIQLMSKIIFHFAKIFEKMVSLNTK